jgi:hypothetical protein
VLSWLQLRVLVQRLPGRERTKRNGGRLEVIHGSGLRGEVGRGSGDVLGGGAGAVESDQAVNLVTGTPAGHPVTRLSHHPGQVMAGDGGPALGPGELTGGDGGGADLDEQFSWPRIRNGDALAGQAGRIGSRCAHGAHGADRLTHGPCPLCGSGPGRSHRASLGRFEAHVAHGFLP